MLFAYDTEAVLAFTVALINTQAGASRSGGDELTGVAELGVLLHEYDYPDRFDYTEAELESIRTLRPQLRMLWSLDRDAAAEAVNGILRTENARPQLMRHAGWDWHLHATAHGAPLANQMRVEAAMALIDVIRSDDVDRLRECAADDCSAVLLDLSRNRSKRYCDVGNCGNRMNVNAYRARQAATAR